MLEGTEQQRTTKMLDAPPVQMALMRTGRLG